MADRVGQQLGNYRLVRLLGRGGFAEVYLGEHVRLGTQAAIKVLHTHLADHDVEGFLTEARIIASLEHPHIVRVLDFDVEGETAFLAMRYAPNGSLRLRYPKGVVLQLDSIVSYIKQAADALQFAHDKRLIHRDIKPENMLLGQRNDVLLSDFGIALIAQSSRLQNKQEIVGTVYYMAPEQLLGKPRLASDQYALGVVAYEWLSGIRPFNGTYGEIVTQHLSSPPPSLREKVPEISTVIEEVVLTALRKDPSHRFASVRAFATALEQACQGVSFHQVTLPSEFHIRNEPPPPTHSVSVNPPNQTLQLTSLATPPQQLFQPTSLAIPADRASQSNNAITPYSSITISPSPMQELGLAGQPRSFQYRLSLRIVMAFLAGLLIVSGTLTWLVLSHLSSNPVTTSVLNTTPTVKVTPTPTFTPTPTLRAPVLISPANGAVFNYFPRSLTLKWSPVPGAIKYGVKVDIYLPGYTACDGEGIVPGSNSGIVPPPPSDYSIATTTSFTFEFDGAQPGCWQVWAIDASGKAGFKSAWREFDFKV